MPASPAIRSLLSDLPAGVRIGCTVEPDPGRRLSTGNEALDALLEGGFPRARLSEVSGPDFSGRTSVLYGLLASTTAAGEVGALIDPADRFDPHRAGIAGVHLPALLWVRPPDARRALRCAEILLAARGFALVALDLAESAAVSPPDSAWARLARRTSESKSALVAFTGRRLAGSFASLCLGLARARPVWLRPPLLGGLETRAEVLRQRGGVAGAGTHLHVRARSG